MQRQSSNTYRTQYTITKLRLKQGVINVFRRPTCMESCLAHGKPYQECEIWCYPPTAIPTDSYLVPTAYTVPIAPYNLNQAVSNIPTTQPYPYYTYGSPMANRWECYRRCIRSGGSPASCCYYCELC